MYADGFERMGMQRPVIFYSNGYETFIWDDKQYNTYRPVVTASTARTASNTSPISASTRPHPGETQPRAEHCRPPYQIEAIQNCRR